MSRQLEYEATIVTTSTIQSNTREDKTPIKQGFKPLRQIETKYGMFPFHPECVSKFQYPPPKVIIRSSHEIGKI
jgi:hypothetical protein